MALTYKLQRVLLMYAYTKTKITAKVLSSFKLVSATYAAAHKYIECLRNIFYNDVLSAFMLILN